jgi:hypothetical protein
MTDLKLLALDKEDLDVISATTQDAVVRVGDMAFARRDGRFMLLMNRFAWEAGDRRGRGERRRCALSFSRVTGVRTAGFDANARDGVLDLLAIAFAETDPPSGIVELRFAGGATLRLAVEVLEARLADTGAAWAARARPRHDLDGVGA